MGEPGVLPTRFAGEAGRRSRNEQIVATGFPRTIGVPGFEPGTSPTRTERATRLRHTPSPDRVPERLKESPSNGTS